MAAAFVSATTGAGGQNGGTTASIDTTGASLLVAVCGGDPPASNFTVSDSKGNTWTALTEASGGGFPNGRMYYVANPTVGTGHTFTLGGTNIYAGIEVASFSGITSTSPFDQQNGVAGSAADGGTATAQPGSITPSENNELVVAGICVSDSSTVTINSGMTVAPGQIPYAGGSNPTIAIAYIVQTTAAAINPTWDGWAGTAGAAFTIASFKEGAAAATYVAPVIDVPRVAVNRAGRW